MRSFFKAAFLLSVTVTVMILSAQPSQAWTVTVKNESPAAVEFELRVGAFGAIYLYQTLDPGQSYAFNTGAECPLVIGAKFTAWRLFKDGAGHDNQTEVTEWDLQWMTPAKVHACWDSRWRYTGVDSRPSWHPDN